MKISDSFGGGNATPAPKGVSAFPRRVFIRVEEGSFGYHAILEGAHGDWAANKTSAVLAVRDAVARHILGKAMVDAEAEGCFARVDIREVGNQLWAIECTAIKGPNGSAPVIQTEARGSSPTIERVDRKKVKKHRIRQLGHKARKVAAMLMLAFH